jgi:hypothetical protein
MTPRVRRHRAELHRPGQLAVGYDSGARAAGCARAGGPSALSRAASIPHRGPQA